MKDTSNFTVTGGPSVVVKKVDQAKVTLGARTPEVGGVGNFSAEVLKASGSTKGPRDAVAQALVSKVSG